MTLGVGSGTQSRNLPDAVQALPSSPTPTPHLGKARQGGMRDLSQGAGLLVARLVGTCQPQHCGKAGQVHRGAG